MPKPTTVREFFKLFPDDAACLQHLFDVRFGQGHVCPRCEREAKWYPIEAERAFSCQWCGNHLHPTVGTIFEKSRTPLQLWFYVVFLFTTTRHGVSAKEIQRQTGVTYKTAHRMGHKIREHMAEIDGEDPLGGVGHTVEIDETMVGGVRKGKRGRGAAGKTVVLGMLQRDGAVMVKVVPNVRRSTLQPIIEANVRKGSYVDTDELASYDNLSALGYDHDTVNHSEGRYVSDEGVTVNSIENFWRHLKCSIKGTHTSVSAKYLERYAKEFEYRFNRRKRSETMLSELLSTYPTRDA
ncbi:IS1595 family transposase [Oceanibacterium hippocampi]|uniref:ISXO2-like transposase domain protein n=1 Tax=Oceanibacterium hippocampi TaxID=745714 RepID=A0A1Y5S1C5_9PROT|nr:IS1595 family transposase [Oceanibacterium hippocampi]SLN30387.1 ISXO2-like transposase domain protein [Oceanibacterium hippocampi]